MKINHRLESEPVLYKNLPVNLREHVASPNYSLFKPHWHTRLEMLFITEGSMEILLNDHYITAKEGDIILINPEVTHEGHTSTDSVKYRVIMFEYDSFIYDKATRQLLEPFQFCNSGFVEQINDTEIMGIAHQIFDIVQNKPDGFQLQLRSLIYYMLGILINRYVDTSLTKIVYPKAFDEVMDYISKNFCKEITTSSISKLFGYNESYFCRRFKEATGLKPLKYIRIMRLEKAKQLLKTSDRSIVSIATECGFTDANYFSRCFKSYYKMTPKEYQSQNT